jgi:hypothetical protein
MIAHCLKIAAILSLYACTMANGQTAAPDLAEYKRLAAAQKSGLLAEARVSLTNLERLRIRGTQGSINLKAATDIDIPAAPGGKVIFNSNASKKAWLQETRGRIDAIKNAIKSGDVSTVIAPFLPSAPNAGQVGRVSAHSWEIFQITGPESLTIQRRSVRRGADSQVVLDGVDTINLREGARYMPTGIFLVVGSQQFTTAGAGVKTMTVFKAMPEEEWQEFVLDKMPDRSVAP